MEKVDSCRLSMDDVAELKQTAIDAADSCGFQLQRKAGDRTDVPIDFRFLDLLLKTAGDPEIGFGEYAQGESGSDGERGCQGCEHSTSRRKMAPRFPGGSVRLHGTLGRRRKCIRTFEEKVLEVIARSGDPRTDLPKNRFPNQVIALLGAQRKEKPAGKVSARVLFDGTHGLCVNSRTRLSDQERAPIADDLTRTMREKAKVDELAFALTADVMEAHRQVSVHPDDWHLLGCQVVPRGEVFVNTVGTCGIASASYYWSRVAAAVGRLLQYLAGNTSTSRHMLCG